MKKTALVTGVNRGIGYELAKQLMLSEFQVIGLCRRSNDSLNRLGVQVVEGVDVRQFNTIKAAQRQLQHIPFDLVVNVAGILNHESVDTLDNPSFAQIDQQFQTNALGPLKIVAAFLNQIRPGGKIVMITSRMGSIADNTSGGRYGYRMSKAALNAAAKSLAIDLKSRQISVGIIHPGWVKTAMTNNHGLLTPEESAALIMARIRELSPDTSGTFLHANGDQLPW